MANPPQAGKMTPERPFPALIETGKSSPKAGLSPAVCRPFRRPSRRWFPDGSPAARPPGSGPVRLPRALGYAAQAIRESNPRDRRPKTAWPWV